MSPNQGIQRFVLFLVVAAYAGLYAWLLIDTLQADEPFEPRAVQANLLPVLSGSLGLVLALSLGIEANLKGGGFRDRLKRLFTVSGLLTTGAVVYAVSAIAGGVVWGIQDDVTPALVTTVVLTVVGYAAAAVTALARG